MELTLKEYADTLGISYQAVRQSFTIHLKAGDLEEGRDFYIQGGTTRLTAAGIERMNSYRKKPVIPVSLPDELQKEVAVLQNQLADARKSIALLEDARETLARENENLAEELNAERQRMNDKNEQLIDALSKLQEALYQIQAIQGRLLDVKDTAPPEGPKAEPVTAEAEAEEEAPAEPEVTTAATPKKGFFARLFG